jgi:hypothetical protein
MNLGGYDNKVNYFFSFSLLIFEIGQNRQMETLII